jgi:plasmid stabilization system protein ParE
MSFRVKVLRAAERDVDAIVEWIAVQRRSPSGASSWLDAYEDALRRLAEIGDTFGMAPECDYVSRDIRQLLFSTRRGKAYRMLFTVEGDEVRVLHVRGPGQRLLAEDEVRDG